MQGLHLTADLSDCQCALHWLTDAAQLGAAFADAQAVVTSWEIDRPEARTLAFRAAMSCASTSS